MFLCVLISGGCAWVGPCKGILFTQNHVLCMDTGKRCSCNACRFKSSSYALKVPLRTSLHYVWVLVWMSSFYWPVHLSSVLRSTDLWGLDTRFTQCHGICYTYRHTCPELLHVGSFQVQPFESQMQWNDLGELCVDVYGARWSCSMMSCWPRLPLGW